MTAASIKWDIAKVATPGMRANAYPTETCHSPTSSCQQRLGRKLPALVPNMYEALLHDLFAATSMFSNRMAVPQADPCASLCELSPPSCAKRSGHEAAAKVKADREVEETHTEA